ncbi:MAG: hypothetical protein NAG76_18125 [Candidatus Pristimantibacillus lignocellulolyticus]|uniref:Uncharacterized protein n=1 Tax=Candidatus Pristimantibacillus lignocellulolyticus TaxID=2994561 RepID=A0A9J6ZC88_9BACL|nr:MAG: hypothetical protein NAG76_18125 [Candidatus Pristimantibacillus lignocellulolyticus]
MLEITLSLLTWLVGLGLVIMLMYWIVSSAIDSSKLTIEVNQLKQLVQQLINDRDNPANMTNNGQIELQTEQCPACGTTISPQTTSCPECELVFLNKEVT